MRSKHKRQTTIMDKILQQVCSLVKCDSCGIIKICFMQGYITSTKWQIALHSIYLDTKRSGRLKDTPETRRPLKNAKGFYL